MNSAIYEGWVRHRRVQPRAHQFRYRMFMVYLDLSETAEFFALSRWWSDQGFNLAQFRRRDYYAPDRGDLGAAILDRVEARTGERPAGPVRVLTHLRYFGYCFNPVSFYYVYDAERLHSIVAEITNTPWKQRHDYVLRMPGTGTGSTRTFEFDKQFHVSPFLDMGLRYRWRFSVPDARLLVHMEVANAQARQFDATLVMHRQPATTRNLDRALLRYPLMTAKVAAGIHWQALKLWLKRVPVYDHPHKTTRSTR